jgi:hypothetical protein
MAPRQIEPGERNRFERTGEACWRSCSVRSLPIRRSPALPPTGPYGPRKRQDAIAERGARPCRDPVPQKRQAAEGRSRRGNRTERGPALWRRWSGYHRRSRAEMKMHCVKLLSQRPMARDVDRQVAELQIRLPCRTATPRPPSPSPRSQDWSVQQKPKAGRQTICAKEPPRFINRAGKSPRRFSPDGWKSYLCSTLPRHGQR